MKPAPEPAFLQVSNPAPSSKRTLVREDSSNLRVSGRFGGTTSSNVVVELEHHKPCLRVLVNSGKHGLTCKNVDSGSWAKSADFGLEGISCGIPAESRGAPSSVEDDREHAIVDQSPREARASLSNRNRCSGSVGDGLNPRVA